MSEITKGVIGMPFDLAMGSELSRRQYHARAQELLAENERLHASDQEATELCDCLSVLLGGIAVAVRGPEEPKTRHGFNDLPSRVKTVVAERDQLKAENEALCTALKVAEVAMWKAESNMDNEAADIRDLLAAMGKGEKS
jgi:outer membrane murein-binding lipoprotein Lpp